MHPAPASCPSEVTTIMHPASPNEVSEASLIEVHDLEVLFPLKGIGLFSAKRYVHAVDDIDFQLRKGEIFCLVGESGSGKTTTALAICGLVKQTSGSIIFQGKDIASFNRQEAKESKLKIQMIFQDPFESLPPHMTVLDIVTEPLTVNRVEQDPIKRFERATKILEEVGLTPPENFVNKFPHQLSGGQRQRVAVASVLVLNPELIVADEPVSMLDMSIRGGILKLMLDLKEKFGLTIVFITHDLSLVRLIGSRIAVMYLGKIVEIGSAKEIIDNPVHPYTKALASVVPRLSSARQNKIILRGETPNAVDVPLGCRFHPRCPFLFDARICSTKEPSLIKVDTGHFVYCHFAQELKNRNL